MTTLIFIELFLIGIGVSMDAFAVAICKGLSFKKYNIKNSLIVALYFGIFQAAMPLIGYMLGLQFQDSIESIDHWIAFILLAIIGLNMIKEGRKSDNCNCCDEQVTNTISNVEATDSSLSFKTMSALAIATSIDALAVGVTFAFLRIDILPAIVIIGLVTFVTSFIGVKIGSVFGSKYKSKAEIFGGIILIIIAFNILFEHLGFINF